MRIDVLTTTQCARALGVTGAFIRGEIRDGRLTARAFRRASGRTKYRIEIADFDSYVECHWPKANVSRGALANTGNTGI